MRNKLIITILALCCLTGCASAEREMETSAEVQTTTMETQAQTEIAHERYVATGRYYTCGELVTNDGNVWKYAQDTISEMESYDHQPVFAVFDDNGTPDNIYDDEVCGLVRDIETEIYDALEVALSEDFAVERNGNVLSVSYGE